MRGAGDGIFIHSDARGEKSRDEIDVFTGGTDDRFAAGQVGKKIELGTNRAHIVFGIENSKPIAGLVNFFGLGAKAFDQPRRRRRRSPWT